LTVRNSTHFVANQGTSSGIGCKSQSVLRALRLTILFGRARHWHEHVRSLFGLETGPARVFRWRIGRGGFAGLRAASQAMPTLLRRIEKSEIDEAEIQAFRQAAPAVLRNWIGYSRFRRAIRCRSWREGGVIVIGNLSDQILGLEKPYVFWE